MNCAQIKWEKISVFMILIEFAALVLGLLWLAESNLERVIFGIGIVLGLVCLIMSKAHCFIYLFFIGMGFSACYTGKVFMPFLCYSNSNQDILTANSVWSEPQNELCDPYGGDALMYTIFLKKKCMISMDGYYRDYAKAMFKDVVLNDSIPRMVNHEGYLENAKFENIGISLARNHVLLFRDTDTNALFNNATYVFVNPTNLEECAKAILVNDDMGNIYIMAESEWINE